MLTGLWFLSGLYVYWAAPTRELKRRRLERIISGFVSAHTFGQWEFFDGRFQHVRPPLRYTYYRWRDEGTRVLSRLRWRLCLARERLRAWFRGR